MIISEGEYVICQPEDMSKALLAKVVEKAGKGLYVVQGAEDDNNDEFSITEDDIFANLGVEPKFGQAYGKKTEPLLGKKTIKSWGPCYFYIPYDKAGFLEKVTAKFKTCSDTLDDYNLRTFAYATSFRLQPPGSKIAGTAQLRKDIVHLNIFLGEHSTLSTLQHVIFHEFAHGVWWKLLTDKDRSKWIYAYLEFVDSMELSSNSLSSVCALLRGNESKKLIIKENGDLAPQINLVHDWICHRTGLRAKDVELLRVSGEDILDYLPSKNTSLWVVEMLDNPISTYANKNVEEFWCESFAAFMSGQPGVLPAKLEKLMEKTLDNASTHG